MSDPTREEAMEGLDTAIRYCENRGWNETANELLEIFSGIRNRLP